MSAPGVGKLSSTVEIRIQARHLPKMDAMSQSDPIAVLFIQKNGNWIELDRTEWIKDNPNPNFVKPIIVEYFFEEVQNLQLVLYDLDNSSASLADDDLLGRTFFTLGDLVGSAGNALERPLLNDHKKASGTVRVSFEEVQKGESYSVVLGFGGRGLDNLDTFSKSDPFFIIKRVGENGSKLPVIKSEVIMNNLNPAWKEQRTTSAALCNGDLDRPLVIEVWDFDDNGKHDLIGGCETSLRALSSNGSFASQGIPLINPEKKARRAQKGKAYEHSGVLLVRQCSLTRCYSFLDYMSGGLEISLMASIDYTGSNGDPQSPNSLHFLSPNMNQYEHAISSIGAVLAPYDTDSSYPVWGFGGQVNGKVDHCFALNGNPANPEVKGVEGILAAYRASFAHVSLSGPTLFAPTIRNAAAVAQAAVAANRKSYFILLIITDGAFNDAANTIDAIVEAANLPLSIVIVGVGMANFDEMHKLDGDEHRLRDSRGRAAVRDIVQFVAMRDYSRGQEGKIAADTLREIPSQVVAYMQANNIVPK